MPSPRLLRPGAIMRHDGGTKSAGDVPAKSPYSMSADPVAALEARVQRAEDLWRRGAFAAALRQYTVILRERLSEARRSLDAVPTFAAADLVIAERVSDLSVLFGYVDAADDLLAGAASAAAQSGNALWADFLRTKRIDLTLNRGRAREAYALLAEMNPRVPDVRGMDLSPAGLVRWESACHWPQAQPSDRTAMFTLLYLSMGRILSSVGQYGDAVTVIGRGLFHAGGSSAPDLARQALTHLKLSLSAALLEKGLLSESERVLAALEPALRASREPGSYARWLELNGKLCLLTGKFGEALKKFRGALAFCQQHGFERAAQGASINLAHALIFFNQTAEAREILEEAASKARAMGDEAAATRAAALLPVAHARVASLADAVSITPTVTEHWGHSVRREATGPAPAADDSLLNLPQSDSFLADFEDRTLGFYWLLGRRAAGAARFLDGMKQSFQDSDSLLIRERLQVLDAALAYYQGEYRQAEVLLGRSLAGLRELDLLPELWQAQRLLGWCMAKLGAPQNARGALAEETSRLLGEMTDSLPQEERAVFLLNKWTAEEENIAGEVNHLTRLKEEMDVAPWWRRPALRWRLWRRLDALMGYIDRYKSAVTRRAVSGREKEVEVASTASLARRLWRCPRREAVISFLVLPDRVLIIRAGWLSLNFGVSAATRLQVRELVSRWHELVRRVAEGARGLGARPGAPMPAADSVKGELENIAEGLAAVLQLPGLLDTLPAGVSSLTIVPDDSLHGFPFAAIRHRQQYLVENYALSYAFEHGQRSPAGVSGGAEALCVGVSEGTREYDSLLYVTDELDLVVDWLRSRQTPARRLDDTGDQTDRPSKELLLETLPRAALAHIACHGVFKPDLPDHSGMILPSPAGQSEVLSIRELSTLNLQRLKHITVSSCWSADHFILPGRWVISLPETLLRAGAGSALGCLWLVDDYIGMRFMARFYSYLDKLPRREALRQAQRDCLDSRLGDAGGADTSHPLYWAGYQLYGGNSDLRL